MIKLLFVCHGNICRSVAAEYIFNDLINKKYLKNEYYSDSAACRDDEIGSEIYGPMKNVLIKHNINIGSHRARLITSEDLNKFDYILIMDKENYNDLQTEFKTNDNLSKIKFLKSFANNKNDNIISDPWYTRDFELAYEEIKSSIEGLIDLLEND